MSKIFRPESCPKEGVFFLEASAGTGKTHALERIVAQLIGRNENPLEIEDILVVTFTDRAAREMKERIRNYLLSLSREGKEESRSLYRRAISGFDRAAIYTIHGFCKMVLACWPFESASPFKQELLIGGEIEEREVRAWIAALRKENFNWNLMRAAYRGSRDIEDLILKLVHTIISDKIPINARVKPNEEDLANFLNFFETAEAPGSALGKAAYELFEPDWSKAEILAVFKEGGGKRKRIESVEKIQTRMAACRELKVPGALSEVVFNKDKEKHFLELLRAALAAESSNFKLGKPLVDALNNFFTQMEPYVECPFEKDDPPVSLVESYMNFAFTDFAAREIRKRIKRVKLSSGQWGYADLIRGVFEGVLEPNSPLLSILRSKFSAALIDEFQDTDPRQWMLFKRVFGEEGTGHLLGLIGDPKQSIYGFRGTGLQTYLEAKNVVPRNKIFRLGTNYRSKENLVRAVNRLFAPLFESTEVGFEPVESGYKGERVLEWPEAKAAITMLGVKSSQDSAALIAGHIRKLLDAGEGGYWRLTDGSRERVLASDIAVLVRKEKEEEEIFLRLRSLGIRTRKLRTRSVFDQEIVELIDVMLSAFDNPQDISCWRSLLLGNFFSLPPVYLDRFEEEGRLDDFVDKGNECRNLFSSGRSTRAMEEFFRFSTVLGEWICAAGDKELGAYFARPWPERILAEPEGERIWQDWRHICELIQSRQSEGMWDISLIREWLQEDSALSDGAEGAVRLESEESAVRVLTMHKAKGLEFPLVFIHGGYGTKSKRGFGEEGYRFMEGNELVVDRLRLRSNWMRHLRFEWEENKRLWYVAFTRAAEKVWNPIVLEGALTQGESLLGQALGLSEGDSVEAAKLPPHQILTKEDAETFRVRLNERLSCLCQDAPELFSFSIGGPLELPPLEFPVTPEPTCTSLPAAPFGNRDLVQSSFSSLIPEKKSLSGLSPAVDDVILASDGGTTFGTLVHTFFESCDFERAREFEENQWCSDGEINKYFLDIVLRFYDFDWYTTRALNLKKMVWRSLRAKIPGLGCLCDVGSEMRKTEVEFVMAIRKNNRLNLKDIDVHVSHGFLRGYIDLLVCTGRRWWVVDWKTNLPPRGHWKGVYDDAVLGLIMNEHHHHFQYELYLLALCGSLSVDLGRAVNWKEEIGGAAYVFVRGTSEKDSMGIRLEKPPLERMLALASKMGVGDVLQ